ncbi:MAG: hypothetical protein JKY87_07795 [Mariprofundus sp.]|nr:hypothetical protein [Mariprofundus sp.]
MNRIALLILLLLSSSCTTTMYVAKTGIITADKKCTIQTYWYKTDYIVGSKVDEILNVRMGGHRPVIYKSGDNGIVYWGEKKRDIKSIGAKPTRARYVCGKVEGLKSLQDFDGDILTLTMHCEAKLSPLSITSGYIPAREEAYVLQVSQQENFSWISSLPEAPSPPTCTPSKL